MVCEMWERKKAREQTSQLTMRAISFSDLSECFICSNSNLLVLWTTTTFSALQTLATVCVLLFQILLHPILWLARQHCGHRDKNCLLLITSFHSVPRPPMFSSSYCAPSSNWRLPAIRPLPLPCPAVVWRWLVCCLNTFKTCLYYMIENRSPPLNWV